MGVSVRGEQARRIKPGDVVVVETRYGLQHRERIMEILWRGGSQYAAGGFHPRHYEKSGRLAVAVCRSERVDDSSRD